MAATTPYAGAATCDLTLDPPADIHGDGLILWRDAVAAWPADPTPQRILADWLEEYDRNQQRVERIRVACNLLWPKAAALRPDDQSEPWDYNQAKAAMANITGTVGGWRLACMWGCLVAYHAPSGDGRPMGTTWVDARVDFAWRGVWFWTLGLAATNSIVAAWNQADAAVRQAYAAWSQAFAAGSQAHAAWSQAYAAWSQAYAAGSQAHAAGSQAHAAWSQAYAAGRQVWQYARECWRLCLPLVGAFED